MTVLYEVNNGLYVNMTNRCPCSCSFCLRKDRGSGSLYGDLWLEREPEVSEVIEEFKKRDLSEYEEIVFCGFGEPAERLYDVFEVCDYLKTATKLPIRINTNGLADLIRGKSTAPDFKGRIDVVSISLNTPSKERYYEITKCRFGPDAFDAMLRFAGEVKNYVGRVVMSTVGGTITEAEERQCAEICARIGAEYRIRPYEKFAGAPDKLAKTALAMCEYMAGDAARINHFMKVHGYAQVIGKAEGLSSREREILEAAAYTHDIGIKLSEEKYGSDSGYYQQIEGPAEAEKLLRAVGYDDGLIDRVKYLISRHHKYNNIDGADCRILIEADFIVNCGENEMSRETINDVYEKIFKTRTGREIMRNLYGAGEDG